MTRFLKTDTVENIRATPEYEKAGLILYAVATNYLNGKRDLDIIPHGNKVTSYNKIKAELEKTFNFLISDKILSEKLNKELIEQNNEKFPSISIKSRLWDGGKNFDFEKDVKSFFGKEMMAKILYLSLEEYLNEKNSSIKKKKI